jgi:predicted nucleotidyltransferase
MVQKDIENIIIEQLISYDPELIGLFGSYLEEGKRPHDIDILVRFRKNLSLLQLIRLENRLSELLGIKADLVTEGALKK